MGRTVALIISTAYSGSSLLNLLLDAQPGIRGLGEVASLLAPINNAHCNLCAKPVRECPLRAVAVPSRFYGSLFDYYGDCEVLVDSSKSVQDSLAIHPFERDLAYRVLLLSKSPHEFAWSYIHHHIGQTAEAAFRLYLDFYVEQMRRLFGQAWFRPWCCQRLTYRQLATRTGATLQELVEFLLGNARPAGTTWQTDTHIIGGNWMVAAQIRGQQSPFNGSGWYLCGKYVDKYHTIFYDDQWKADRSFISKCLQFYQRWRSEIEQVLHNLGQPDFVQQVSDLQKTLALFQNA